MNTQIAYKQEFVNINDENRLKLAYKKNELYGQLLNKEESVCVVGLGYVGLPLALHMASKFKVVGFDINEEKILQLWNFQDPCKELSPEDFKDKDIQFTMTERTLGTSKFYVVAVPTPIDKYKIPNLEPLKSATALVAKNLKKGDCVVFESTVYPGCTEEVCVPILERISRLQINKDFTVGYSPERINPGDKEHTFTKIKKIVSGSNKEALDLIANVYESVVEAGIHKAECIKVAEAAKVVENIQRDVNIGLMNELSQVFHALDINTKDVLKAAGTKWNFHNYYPGLVGGHCIGVDPYYLIERAKKFSVRPQILETVRKTNEGMTNFIVNVIRKRVWTKQPKEKVKILVKGITFKEDVNDIRNSKVADIIKQLCKQDYDVTVEDPHAEVDEVKQHYNIDLTNTSDINTTFDVVVMAVNHKEYKDIEQIDTLINPGGFLFDLRGTFKHLVPSDMYITL